MMSLPPAATLTASTLPLAPSSPVSTPTSRETDSLVALLAAHAHVPLSPLPQVLAEVFDIVSQRWVADFLFSTDMSALSALTAPVNIRHATVATVTMTSVSPTAAHFASPFDVHVQGDYVFVPAFSVGSLSVGFGIENCSARRNSDWGGHMRCFSDNVPGQFRFARDDQRGILLNVRQAEDPNLIKVDYMAHRSTTARRRAFLTLTRAAIEEALRHDDSSCLDVTRLHTHVQLIQVAEEYRECPLCRAPHGSNCGCRLPLRKSRHPLDFDAMSISMSSHLGAYEGTATARFCDSGLDMLTAHLGTRMKIDCGLDGDLLQKMTKWAITDQLQNVRESPVQSIMPAPDASMTDAQPVSSDGLTTSDSLFRSEFASAEGESGINALDDDVPLDGNVGLDDDMELDEAAVSRLAAVVDELSGPLKWMVENDETGVRGRSNETASGDLSPEHISPASTDADADADAELDADVEDDVNLAAAIAREAGLAYAQENEVTYVQGQETEVARSEKSFREAVRLAPATATQSGTHDADAKDRGDDKVRKAELRKQRNREAAQRSNARRKRRNDELKQALRDSHGRAAELRARELALREENIRLRKRMS